MDSSAVYQSLRQELLDSYNRQVNLVTFALTATAALIGYGFTAQNPLIFLLPILILWLSFIQLNNSMYTIFTISVYIRGFIEPKYDIPKWERDISDLRAHLRTKKPFDPLKRFNPITSFDASHYARAIIGMGVVCIILSIGYAIYWGRSWYEYLISAIVAVFWIISCTILLRPIAFVDSGDFEKVLQEAWKKLNGSAGASSPKAE